MRVIAIDWSGAKVGARRKIWLAEAADGYLVRLESGRNREEMAEHLVREAERDPRSIVGFDFAFSLPAWFLEEHGLKHASELWALAERNAEAWLAACEPPFWGRPDKKRPDLPGHLRRTDREVPSTSGIRPKSVFQIGGAGAVGTGSLRGMPLLSRLHSAGFSVWPFDPPALPRVVEIYPRLLTGPVNKGNVDERSAYVTQRYAGLDNTMLARATSSEDAFDAAISALVMDRSLDDLAALGATTDKETILEGRKIGRAHV